MQDTKIKTPKWFAGFEWLLAWRYLKSRKKKRMLSVFASLSLIGIMVGVAALITVMSVMNGFRRDIMAKLGGAEGHITVFAGDGPLTDYDEVTKRIEKIPGVLMAFPIIRGQVFVSTDSAGSGAVVVGMRKEDIEKRIKNKKFSILHGDLTQFGKIPNSEDIGILVGYRLADHLFLYTGNPLKVTTPNGVETAFGTAPRVRDYTVVGLSNVDLPAADRITIFMPYNEAIDYFNFDKGASEIAVYLNNPDQIDNIIKQIETDVGRSVYISDWRKDNGALFSALEVEKSVMFLILTLIIIVASLNILSGLIMLVMTKSSDIAILRTMGASSGSILRIFIISGATIGILGTSLGLGLGLLITNNIASIQGFISDVLGIPLMDEVVHFLKTLPADIDPRQVIKILVFSFSLSILTTIYPAYRASRLDPVQALRYG